MNGTEIAPLEQFQQALSELSDGAWRTICQRFNLDGQGRIETDYETVAREIPIPLDVTQARALAVFTLENLRRAAQLTADTIQDSQPQLFGTIHHRLIQSHGPQVQLNPDGAATLLRKLYGT